MHCEIINYERIDVHRAPIYALHTCSMGIYSGGADRQLIFQAHDAKGIGHVLATFPESIFSIATTPQEIWVGGFEGHCYIIQRESKIVTRLVAHDGPIFSIISINDHWMASAGADGKIHIWDIQQKSIIRTIWLGTEKLRSIRFDTSTQLLWVASNNGSLTLLDVPWFNTLEEWTDAENPCYDMAYIASKEVYVSAHKNGKLHFWKRQQPTPLLSIPAHQGAIYGLKYDPQQNVLFSGSVDKTVKCWDLNEMKPLFKWDDYHDQPFRSINKIDFWNYELIICGDQAKIDFIKICFFE